MYQKVSTDLNFVDREKQVEKFWKDNDIFRKSMENNKEGETQENLKTVLYFLPAEIGNIFAELSSSLQLFSSFSLIFSATYKNEPAPTLHIKIFARYPLSITTVSFDNAEVYVEVFSPEKADMFFFESCSNT